MAGLNTEKLAAMVRAKRGRLGLRDAAKQIGNVSASTLSRVEQGKVPDLETFFDLCKWLDVRPDEFSSIGSETTKETKTTTPETIEVHLRADRTLAPDTVDALVTMIRLAYDAAKKQ